MIDFNFLDREKLNYNLEVNKNLDVKLVKCEGFSYYLIDDNVWNGVEDFEGIHLHFGTDPQFMNWDDTLKFLLPND